MTAFDLIQCCTTRVSEWEDEMELPECVFRVFEAKSAARKNRTVGSLTSFEILIQGGGRFDITDEFFDLIKSKRRMRKVPTIKPEEPFLIPADKNKVDSGIAPTEEPTVTKEGDNDGQVEKAGA
jgi:hypothetical protein